MEDHGVKGFLVGDWFVEPALSRIKRGDEVEHIEPRSMAVLECLVAHAGEVMPQKSLIKAVWGEAFVGDEVLTHAIWELRKAFGDNARSPTYIQTISKRGYRLVAKVRSPDSPHELSKEQSEEQSTPQRPVSTWIAGGLAVALAVLLATWFVDKPQPEPLIGPEPTLPTRPRLLVTLKADHAADPELQLVLNAVSSELAGIDDFEIITRDDPGGRPFTLLDHGLELSPAPAGGSRNVAYRLYSRSPRSDIYGDTLAYGPDTGVGELAESLARTINQFSEINTNELYHDPDLEPWIDLKSHDWTAIQLFFRAARPTLNGEQGHGSLYVEAANKDAEFLAPLAWGFGEWTGGTDEIRADYARRLERLEEGLSDFESAVARYVLRLLDKDYLQARKSLLEALDIEPDNGPILVNLAVLERRINGPKRALDTLMPLIGRRWRYPSVYTQAAYYALELGDFERAREILQLGLEAPPDVIDTLALLEALALLDDDLDLAAAYRERFQARLEMLLEGERQLRVGRAYQVIIDRARAAQGPELAGLLEARLEEISGKTD